MPTPIKSPAYQWYPKDILTSVRVAALSDMEELWYRRALDFCWLNITMPADPELFARVVGRGCTVEGALAVMQMFRKHPKDGTKLVHDRQQKERRKQSKNRQQKSQAGKASAEKRRKERELEERQRARGRATAVEIPSNGNPTLQSPNSGKEGTSNEVSSEEASQPKKPRPRATRIPEPFMLTSEMRAYAAEKRPNIDVQEETEKFVNHFRGKAGKDATKLDWNATWRNWILNARGLYESSKSKPERNNSYRDRRAQEAIDDRNTIEEIRAELAATEIPESHASGRERQLSSGLSTANNG